MNVRLIGGMWRRIEGSNVRSFTTYQDAVNNKNAWEDFEPQTTTDDILEQMKKK